MSILTLDRFESHFSDYAQEFFAEPLDVAYTQTTDIEIEINGLMTYDRRAMKYNPAVLKAVHEKVIRLVK